MIEYAVISKQPNEKAWTVHSKTTYHYSFYKTKKAVQNALNDFEQGRLDMIDYLKQRLQTYQYVDSVDFSADERRRLDEDFLKEYEDKIYKIGYWTDDNSPMYLLETNEELEIKRTGR